MCKFAVYHSEEFTNPVEVFVLGVLISLSNVLCEVTNAIETTSQDSVTSIVSKFVAFKILIQIQDYYLRQRQNLQVKAAVKEPLIIKVDNDKIFGNTRNSLISEHNSGSDEGEPRQQQHGARLSIKILYYVLKMYRSIFTTFYFYFFPLMWLAFPFSRLVLSGKVDNFSV